MWESAACFCSTDSTAAWDGQECPWFSQLFPWEREWLWPISCRLFRPSGFWESGGLCLSGGSWPTPRDSGISGEWGGEKEFRGASVRRGWSVLQQKKVFID